MPEKSPDLDEREADRRFAETLGRLVATPPKPHKQPPVTKPKRTKT
jgi:hypothetical protein